MPESYAVPFPLTVTQIAVGLLLPVLAGLAPVLRGTRITTQQALSDVGVGSGNYGRGLIERLLGKLQKVFAIKRPVLLAIRNTLRHKGRLIQTLVVLIFATALFVSVISVRASVDATIASFMRFHQYDVSVEIGRPDLVGASNRLRARCQASSPWRYGPPGGRPACVLTIPRATRSRSSLCRQIRPSWRRR